MRPPNKIQKAITHDDIADGKRTSVAHLMKGIEEIRQVASGEKQVANDDTEALHWIVERIAKLNPPNND